MSYVKTSEGCLDVYNYPQRIKFKQYNHFKVFAIREAVNLSLKKNIFDLFMSEGYRVIAVASLVEEPNVNCHHIFIDDQSDSDKKNLNYFLDKLNFVYYPNHDDQCYISIEKVLFFRSYFRVGF